MVSRKLNKFNDNAYLSNDAGSSSGGKRETGVRQLSGLSK